jgi:hypothetical protein
MGHINFDNLVKKFTKQAVRDMSNIAKPSNAFCKQCQHGKKKRVGSKSKEYSTTKPLELFHMDLCGLTRTQSLQGENYFIFLIYDYSRKTWVTFLKEKLL